MEIKSYLSNPRLKREGQQVALTQQQVEDYIRCANDPVYFRELYEGRDIGSRSCAN